MESAPTGCQAQGAEAALAWGDARYGEGKPAEAAEAYARALAEAPADWSRRGRTLESLLTAMWGAKQYEACALKAVRGAAARAPLAVHGERGDRWPRLCGCRFLRRTPPAASLLGKLETLGREVLAPPSDRHARG